MAIGRTFEIGSDEHSATESVTTAALPREHGSRIGRRCGSRRQTSNDDKGERCSAGANTHTRRPLPVAAADGYAMDTGMREVTAEASKRKWHYGARHWHSGAILHAFTASRMNAAFCMAGVPARRFVSLRGPNRPRGQSRKGTHDIFRRGYC